MSRKIYVFLVLVVAAVTLIYRFGFKPSMPEDEVVSVSIHDKEILEGREKSRGTLPIFWAKFANHESNETKFMVKLGISDQGRVEHMWCVDIIGNADKATCKIDNEPETVHTVKSGQRIDVDPTIISDWMYLKDGKIKGGQSIRILTSRMPEEKRASFQKLFAEE